MRFSDRVVVVTGGGSGLGRHLAFRFAGEGAAVVVADVSEEAAGEVERGISATGGRVIAQKTDVADADSVGTMAREARRAFGIVDILVNNAARATDGDFLDLDAEQWERDVSVALKGSFLCSQALIPGMVEKGAGVVINVASVNALGYYGNEAYSAAKAGVLSLTRSLAVRYGPSGIRANAVVPGTLRTPAWDERQRRNPGVPDRVAAWYPLGRVGEPEDVANAVLFLASREAAWISGVALPVDGGLLAGNAGMMREMMGET